MGEVSLMSPGDILKFTRTKSYIFERLLGKGGTGQTVLLRDDTIGLSFACKKFVPLDEEDRDELYERFITELKLLYQISHKNIVRIFNYYLYPAQKTGYIIMEYISGFTIDSYFSVIDRTKVESIFLQLIEGFMHLEKANILHRDIRAQNILITLDGDVKIIDFGFAKKLEAPAGSDASVLLNWPVDELPQEINEGKYNHQTEVFFVGKLFSGILDDIDYVNFRYESVLKKMIERNPKKRLRSFFSVMEQISKDFLELVTFTEEEKQCYATTAYDLSNHLSRFSKERSLIDEPQEVISRLEELLRECTLEKALQDNSKLINCFVLSNYTYQPKRDIKTENIMAFYKMLRKQSPDKQKVILDNIAARLRTIPVEEEDESMPF